jgi:hypothetical protein
MSNGWKRGGSVALVLLGTATACGDDGTSSAAGGGSGGGGTTSASGSTTVTGSVASSSTATTASSASVASSSSGSSDGGGGATSANGGGGATSDGGGGSTSDGGGGSTSDGGGGPTSDGGAGGETSTVSSGQGGEGGGGVPASWFCLDTWFDATDGCDCECGAYDPDCDDDEQRIFRCGPTHDVGEGRACLPTGICELPEEWSCDDAAYADGATCDCACGGLDYDCRIPEPLLPVENCVGDQSCDDQGECSDVPVGWTCADANYDDGLFCDCECGIYDPDCATSLIVTGCDFAGQVCGLDGTCLAPEDWTCGEDTWNDGTTCNCECGAEDPDCDDDDAPVDGCDVGDVCRQDTCVTPAVNDTCAGVIPLTEGTVNGTWVGAEDDSDPGPAPDGCTLYREQGADVFYSVSLAAGETLTVVIGDTIADSALYLLTDCEDAEGSCVAGVDASASLGETLTYTAPAAQSLFLVVDQYAPSDFVDFELTVTID